MFREMIMVWSFFCLSWCIKKWLWSLQQPSPSLRISNKGPFNQEQDPTEPMYANMKSRDNSWLFIMRALGRTVSSPSRKCPCNRMPMINGYWAQKAKLTPALFCHQNPSQFLPPAYYFNTTIVSNRLTIKGSLACPLFKDLRRRDLKRRSCCRDSRWLTINTAIHTSHKPCNCSGL